MQVEEAKSKPYPFGMPLSLEPGFLRFLKVTWQLKFMNSKKQKAANKIMEVVSLPQAGGV